MVVALPARDIGAQRVHHVTGVVQVASSVENHTYGVFYHVTSSIHTAIDFLKTEQCVGCVRDDKNGMTTLVSPYNAKDNATVGIRDGQQKIVLFFYGLVVLLGVYGCHGIGRFAGGAPCGMADE